MFLSLLKRQKTPECCRFVRRFFLHEGECKSPEYERNESTIQKERQEFLTTYVKAFKSILGGVKTCYVDLG